MGEKAPESENREFIDTKHPSILLITFIDINYINLSVVTPV